MLAFLNSALGGVLMRYHIQGLKVTIQSASDLTELNMLENVETIVRHYLPVSRLTFNRKLKRLTILCGKNRTPGQKKRRRKRGGDNAPPPSTPGQRPTQSSYIERTAPPPPQLSDSEARRRSAVGEAAEEPESPASE